LLANGVPEAQESAGGTVFRESTLQKGLLLRSNLGHPSEITAPIFSARAR